ncbi:hypothetical protein EC957_004629 [Mortierella hygrophila]|uniref:Uncharacterized protein n=1 Tax=Mortierella hygrophila TaxID=979708 RepID=A0A9P6K0F8_9FUNG|nr:hypothetical protein EC957_004629 [Mortierella hygrophila]
MADHHPDHSSESYSVQRPSQLHTQFRQQHHHHHQQPQHLQVPQTQRIHHQNNRQGPYSAGVIEDRRAFPMFRGSGSSSSSNNTANSNSNSNGGRTFAHPSSSFTSRGSSSTKSRTLTISDILERFSSAPEEFVMTVLNAKAKEDELKAEEERYKTEALKLESRKLDISLAIEKRQTTPPAARSYASSTADSSVPMHHGYSTYTTPAQPSIQVDNTRSHYSGTGHQDAQEQAPQQQQKTSHDQAKLPSTPPSRPAPPRIDTARQGSSLQHQHQLKKQQQQQQIQRHLQQQQQSATNSQRIPPSPSTQSPVSGKPSASTSGRHHILHPFRSSSAQSSPVTNVDMQSQIPQPLSPDEYASPTSATPSGSGLKRKSINHDEVMDAIRAKVLRNAATGQQQQKDQREKPHRKTSGDLAGRRKPHPLNSSINSNDASSSPDRSKRPATTLTVTAAENIPSTSERVASPRDNDTTTSTSPTDRPSPSKKDGFAQSHGHRVIKQEEADEALLSPHPITRSPPASMSPPSSASRSNSSSPQMESGKYEYQRQYHRQEHRQSRNEPLLGPSERERARLESMSYAEDERRSRYNMDRSRAERPSEVGDFPRLKTES